MTAQSKDLARILSRAESMRLAITASALPRQWEIADLNHMADAASMLWEQANDLAAREPESKAELSEAISRIFEPLLTWTGRFDLCASLALARGRATPYKCAGWDADLTAFEALAFQGRFQDDFSWQRGTTFGQAQHAYARMMERTPALDAAEIGRIAHAWTHLGMPALAREVLRTSPDARATRAHFEASQAPQHWQDAYISLSWHHLLRDFDSEHSQSH